MFTVVKNYQPNPEKNSVLSVTNESDLWIFVILELLNMILYIAIINQILSMIALTPISREEFFINIGGRNEKGGGYDANNGMRPLWCNQDHANEGFVLEDPEGLGERDAGYKASLRALQG